LEWAQRILAAGEAFSGVECSSLRSMLTAQSSNFFNAYHSSNLEALHSMLEKELWRRLPSFGEGIKIMILIMTMTMTMTMIMIMIRIMILIIILMMMNTIVIINIIITIIILITVTITKIIVTLITIIIRFQTRFCPVLDKVSVRISIEVINCKPCVSSQPLLPLIRFAVCSMRPSHKWSLSSLLAVFKGQKGHSLTK